MINEVELARRRTLMGNGACPWLTEAHMFGLVTASSWTLITGSSAPDLNMFLIHGADPELLTEPLAQIARRGCPSLAMFAGDGKTLADGLPSTYSPVGTMPIMSVDLGSVPRQIDPRVRQATDADADTVTDLLEEAYGLSRDVAALSAAPLTQPGSGGMSFFLLEEDGRAVSTVTVCRTEDAVSLWCMATPERYGRQGHGRALLGAVLQAAHHDGATLGLLGATPAGLPLYEATGWRIEETWDLYTDAVSEQFSH